MESIGTATLPVVIDRAALNKEVDQAGQGVTSQMAGIGKKAGAILGGAAFGLTIAKGLGDTIAAGRESIKVMAQTEAVIKSTGGAARMSAEDFGILAGKISAKTGIDDEAIQSGENLLATFTNIRNEVGKGNDIFSQATGIMVDMGAALGGDASSNAVLLGKALNDPIKGVAALTRVGVSFTAQQKDQIKQLVANNDLLGAQKLILGELTKEFGGSAEAQATDWDKLMVKWGNAQEWLGQKLIPLIDRGARALDSFGGFLSDHPGLVQAVGVAVTTYAVTSFGAWAAELLAVNTQLAIVWAWEKWELLVGWLAQVRAGAMMAAAGFGTMGTDAAAGAAMAQGGLATLGGALSSFLVPVGFLAAGWAIYNAFTAIDRAADKARVSIDKSLEPFDLKSYTGLDNALQELYAREADLEQALIDKKGSTWVESMLKNMPGALKGLGNSEVFRLAGELKAVRGEIDKLEPAQKNLIKNSESVARALNMPSKNSWSRGGAARLEYLDSMAQVSAAAKTLGIDLTGEFGDSGAARKAVETGMRTLAEKAGFYGPRFAEALKLPADELKRRAEEADKFVQGVVSTWAHGLDVVQALGNAEQLTDTSIEFWYMAKLGQANTFKDNLSKAIADGYSPELINRLVAAGPEEGGRLLQGLVDNASGAFVDMVNAAEKAMGEMAFRAAETARLTNIAVHAQTDELVKDLPKAMAIANLLMAGDQSRTLDEMAFKVGTSVQEMQRIAKEYGITIPIDADTSEANKKIDLLMKSWNQALHSLGGTAPPGAVNAERGAGGRSATAGGKSMDASKGYGTTTTTVGNGYDLGPGPRAPAGSGKSIGQLNIYTQDDPHRIIREQEAAIR